MSPGRRLVAAVLRRIDVILPFERELNGLPADQPRRLHKEILDLYGCRQRSDRGRLNLSSKQLADTRLQAKANQATLARVVTNRLRK
jgi:hypothetical protein